MRLILLLLLYSVSTFAFGPYLRKGIDEHPVCGSTYLELKNLPPVRDQGAYGTCYAHSSMLLLEYLRCSKSQNAQACYSDQGSIPHLARFNNSGNLKMIPIGGFPRTLLNNFKSDRKLSKESCASYSVWNNLDNKYREERAQMKVQGVAPYEVDYFYYISRKLKDIRVTREEKSCWAQEIVDAGLGENVDDILRVFNDSNNISWQQLRYKILVPERCTRDSLTYPEYNIVSYPATYGEEKTKKGIRDHIYRALKSGYPTEISFCSSKDGDGNCSFHSATVVGQRHVCNQQQCQLQFRIQNSYGRSWQENNDNGWVSADFLSEQIMVEKDMVINTILPTGTKLDSKLVAPIFSRSPISRNASLSDLASKGMSSNGPDDKCWEVSESSIQFITKEELLKPVYKPIPAPLVRPAPTPTPNPNVQPTPVPDKNAEVEPPVEKKMYVCVGPDGERYAGDLKKEGWKCKEIKF